MARPPVYNRIPPCISGGSSKHGTAPLQVPSAWQDPSLHFRGPTQCKSSLHDKTAPSTARALVKCKTTLYALKDPLAWQDLSVHFRNIHELQDLLLQHESSMEGPLQEGAPRIEEPPNTHSKTPTVKQDPSLNCRVLHIARPPKHRRTPHIMRLPLALHNTNLNCKSLSCTASIPLIAHPHPAPRHCQTPLHPSVPPGLLAMPQRLWGEG